MGVDFLRRNSTPPVDATPRHPSTQLHASRRRSSTPPVDAAPRNPSTPLHANRRRNFTPLADATPRHSPTQFHATPRRNSSTRSQQPGDWGREGAAFSDDGQITSLHHAPDGAQPITSLLLTHDGAKPITSLLLAHDGAQPQLQTSQGVGAVSTIYLILFLELSLPKEGGSLSRVVCFLIA